LNEAKLCELHARTDANGNVRPPEPEPESEPTTPVSFDAGVRQSTPSPPSDLERQIAEAEANGDWASLDVLNTRKLAQAADRQRAADLSA
jgi:hypothetical protein